MTSKSAARIFPGIFGLFALAVGIAGCGSQVTSNTPVTPAAQSGPSFVVGTDAPMASVVSFSVQITSVMATDGNGNTVSLLSGTPTVDFARYNGLQTLLDMNDVAAAARTGASRLRWGPATIGYLQTQVGSAPTIQTMAVTYPQGAATYTLPRRWQIRWWWRRRFPVGPAYGFRSAQVDRRGWERRDYRRGDTDVQISTSSERRSGAYIDCFDAAVVSVNTTAQIVHCAGTARAQVHGERERANRVGRHRDSLRA